MTPVIAAIGIIGGSLIAVKAFGDKKTEADKAGASPDGQATGVNVGVNADAIGYDRIDQATYEEQGGVDAGQSHTVVNGNGEVVGEVVGMEGGNQVFQEADGTVHIRSAGEPEITPMITGNVSQSPAAVGGVASTVSRVGQAVSQMKAANAPRLTFTTPRRPVSSNLVDKRIRASARAGLRLPM